MARVQGLMGPSLSLSIRNLVWPSSSRGAGERELNSDRRGAQGGGQVVAPLSLSRGGGVEEGSPARGAVHGQVSSLPAMSERRHQTGKERCGAAICCQDGATGGLAVPFS